MARQLAILLTAFAVGAAAAGLLGATNLGVAFGVGQLTFAVTLVWLLLRPRDRAR
jgi:uncharacterized membrane protein (DUF485 family)